MSGDPFLYADLGWILHQGGNPYVDVMGSMGGLFAAFIDPFWAGNGVAYPPLSLEVNRLMIAVGGFHPYWGGAIAAQANLPALACMAAGGVSALPRRSAARRPAVGRLAGCAQPDRDRPSGRRGPQRHPDGRRGGVRHLAERATGAPGLCLTGAPIVIGLAMALKQQAGLAVIAAAGLPVAAQLVRLSRPQRVAVLGWRTAVAAVVALTTFVAVSLSTGLGFGWTNWLSQMAGPARSPSRSPSRTPSPGPASTSPTPPTPCWRCWPWVGWHFCWSPGPSARLR